MSYGQQPSGYGQPNLQIGMPVSSDNGWTGTITEIIPAAPGYEGAVRVAWHGDGTTLVALAMFVVEQNQAVIRTQPPPPPPPPPVLQPQPAPQRPVVEDEMSTRLTSPVQNDPSHVNPFVNDPPLVTSEQPPIHPTHGGQAHDDMTFLPNKPYEPATPRDLEATYIPPRDAPAPQFNTQQTYGDEQATYIPPRDAPAPEFRPQPAHSDEQATYIPPRDAPAPQVNAFPPSGGEQASVAPPAPREMPPDRELTTPLDALHAPRPDAMVMETEQREVTVPVVEEQVEARPEWRDAGSITVRTVTEDIPQTLTRETQREELFVERVAVGRELLADEAVMPRDEGDTHIIPIVVEEAVLVTRRILVEELRITKRVIPTTQTVEAVIRKERVEIDAGDLADRVHDATGADAPTDGPHAMGTPRPF